MFKLGEPLFTHCYDFLIVSVDNFVSCWFSVEIFMQLLQLIMQNS